MGFISKTWDNPVNTTASDLNRIEKGIKDSHDTLSIYGDEIYNLQLKQLATENSIKDLISNSPTILNTLKELQGLLNNNSEVLETLKDTSNFVTHTELNNSLRGFSTLKDIKQDGKSILKDNEANIIMPVVDTKLNNISNNAISNKAVTIALENLTANIKIPTHLKDLKTDYHHSLITEDERNLWNTIKNVSFEETDPTVPNWAKQPSKPTYEWNEILNTPHIYKNLYEFPDINQYSTINHNHNNIYSLLGHEHDNRYAGIIHKHLYYSDAGHSHTEYALVDHTHDNLNFDSSLIEEAVNKSSTQIQELKDSLHAVATSGKYTDLIDIPDLSQYILKNTFDTHDHDDKYSLLDHTHDYAKVDHEHNIYSLVTHDHYDEYDNHYALKTHYHDEYALESHSHNYDDLYAQKTHDHNYAPYDHTHDYAPYEHTHNYAPLKHSHTEYSEVGHTHNYADTGHTHTEFSDIVPLNNIKELITTEISEIVGSAPDALNTLEELAKALNNNANIVEVLNASISNKADAGHNHDTVYSKLNHTHSTYAVLDHTHTKSEITDFTHSHSDYVTLTTEQTNISGYKVFKKAKFPLTSTGTDYRYPLTVPHAVSTEKRYLLGVAATTLGGDADSKHTNTNASVYMQSGKLYSNGTEVSVSGHSHTDFLKLNGSNTMTGVLNLKASGANEGNIGNNGIRWGNETQLPQDTAPQFVLTIDSFANGGRTKWASIANLKTQLSVANASHTHSYALVYTGTSTTKGENSSPCSTLRIGFASNNLYIWNS